MDQRLAGGKLLLDSPAEAVIRIRISNPERRNALDHEILDALAETLPRLDRGIQTRCVLITGVPPVFSAGYDIASIPSETFERDAEALVAHPFHTALEKLAAHPWPTVAAINGHCLGGGLELAITCDLRISAAGAKLGMPPAKLGLVYGHTGLRKFLDTVGLARTKELFLTGRNFEAARAEEIGLVNGVVADEHLEEAAITLAAQIASHAPISTRGNKHAIDLLNQCPVLPTSRRPAWSRCANPAFPQRTFARASVPSPRNESPSGGAGERQGATGAGRRRPGDGGADRASRQNRPADAAAPAPRGAPRRRLRRPAARDRRPTALDQSGADDLPARP